MIPRTPTLAVVVIVFVTVGSMGGTVATASSGEPTPIFSVHLQKDGDATITVRMTFDLSSESERTAFESLVNDSGARETITKRFRDRMAGAVAATENATGREMSLGEVSIALSTVDNTGIARLSVVWRDLAAETNDGLVVTEPFASGYTTDRRFVLRAPAGYTIKSVTPAPERRNGTRVVWPAGRDLSGFEVVLAPGEPTTTPTETPTPSPEPTTTEQATTEAPSKATTAGGASDGDATKAATTGTSTETATGGQPGFGIVVALGAFAILAIGTLYRPR